jgi:hypothetical protein
MGRRWRRRSCWVFSSFPTGSAWRCRAWWRYPSAMRSPPALLGRMTASTDSSLMAPWRSAATSDTHQPSDRHLHPRDRATLHDRLGVLLTPTAFTHAARSGASTIMARPWCGSCSSSGSRSGEILGGHCDVGDVKTALPMRHARTVGRQRCPPVAAHVSRNLPLAWWCPGIQQGSEHLAAV